MKWLRRARSAQGRDSADRLAAAQREVEVSRQRLRDTRETVVKPLQDYAEQNSFASIIAASLARGHGKGSAG